MQPDVSLDEAIVAANARAWQSFAGVPLRAVVKGNGYGWGYAPLVRALDGIVQAYCIADADELMALRRYTARPAIVLASVPIERLHEVLEAGGLPTIASAQELRAMQHSSGMLGLPLRVRVGLRPAVGWSGLSLDEFRSFAPMLAEADAEVELWTHITDIGKIGTQRDAFREAARIAATAGVNVTGTDVASTFALVAGGAQGTCVRLGIGLFGATGGPPVANVQCALRVAAPVLQRERLSAAMSVGYGDVRAAAGEELMTARCGYADGLPASLAGTGEILSVGMQYVTARSIVQQGDTQTLTLLDRDCSLDAFAAAAKRLPHEVVTAFGNAAARASAARRPSR